MSERLNTVDGLLFRATAELQRAGVPDARWDAEVLLGFVVGKQPLMLPLLAAEQVPDDAAVCFRKLVRRRATREPLQYILGRQEFMGFEFAVDERVLVPRPETEHLVEAAITHLDAATQDRAATDTMLAADLCTGSGAIAVSLALMVRNLRVFATDISADATAVAAGNIERHGVAGRVTLLTGDLFAPLPADLRGRLTLIVSNPPYIASAELAELQPEVRREPQLALDGGKDGLTLYRRIVDETPRWLCPGGLLALEIGDRQGEEVTGLIADAETYADWCVKTDYAGHDRVVLARTRGETGCSLR